MKGRKGSPILDVRFTKLSFLHARERERERVSTGLFEFIILAFVYFLEVNRF